MRVGPIPSLKIYPPDKRFWLAVGTDSGREIVDRTQSGKNADDRAFKPYKASTIEARKKGYGRGVGSLQLSPVNLTATGKMLNSIARGIRARVDGVKLILTGDEATKAGGIEEGGREFFAISPKQAEGIKKRVINWMTKRNKLK